MLFATLKKWFFMPRITQYSYKTGYVPRLKSEDSGTQADLKILRKPAPKPKGKITPVSGTPQK